MRVASHSNDPVRDKEGRVVIPIDGGDDNSVNSVQSFDPTNPIDNDLIGREENFD